MPDPIPYENFSQFITLESGQRVKRPDFPDWWGWAFDYESPSEERPYLALVHRDVVRKGTLRRMWFITCVAAPEDSGSPGTGGSLTTNTITEDHTITNEDVIFADTSAGQIVVTLPATAARRITIKKISNDANLLVIVPPTGQIELATTLDIQTQFASATVVFDGANWWSVN